MLVPLGDCFNHECAAQVNFKMINTELHLQKLDEYVFETDFDTFDYITDDASTLELDISTLAPSCRPLQVQPPKHSETASRAEK